MIPNGEEDKVGGDGYGSSKMKQSNWRLMGLGKYKNHIHICNFLQTRFLFIFAYLHFAYLQSFKFISHCILGMFFLFYLALGASVFSAIESPIEKQEIKDLIDKKRAFVKSHTCVDGKKSFC